MDFSLHFDTISMVLPIVYFKESQVEFSKLWYISVPEGCFNLHYAAVHLGLHCLPNTSLAVSSIQRVKPVLFYISHSDAYPTDLIMNDFECVLGQYFRLKIRLLELIGGFLVPILPRFGVLTFEQILLALTLERHLEWKTNHNPHHAEYVYVLHSSQILSC